jgi:hypothetical protein
MREAAARVGQRPGRQDAAPVGDALLDELPRSAIGKVLKRELREAGVRSETAWASGCPRAYWMPHRSPSTCRAAHRGSTVTLPTMPAW